MDAMPVGMDQSLLAWASQLKQQVKTLRACSQLFKPLPKEAPPWEQV